MDHFYNYLKGIAIGIANVIPGVSGGTMAVILGIYERLTGAVGSFFSDKENRVKNIVLLAAIGLGAATGILLFARFFSILLSTAAAKQATYFFFIGLIFGSIPFVLKLHEDMKLNWRRFICVIVALALVLLTTYLGGGRQTAQMMEVTDVWFGLVKITEIDISYGIWLIFCGFFAAGSMALPGFSGSALLISLGEYNNILYYVDEKMILPVIFVAIGAVPGIIVFARLINYFIRRRPSSTYYFILGLLLASNFQIGNEIKDEVDFSAGIMAISGASLAVGAAAAYFLSKIKKSEDLA